MKIGEKFKFRHSGYHGDSTLIILHNHKQNMRVLYNIDSGCFVTTYFLLYATPTGIVASKAEIKQYSTKLGLLEGPI